MTAQASHSPLVALPSDGTQVTFPEGQRRSQSPIFAHNELFIAAPAERIWAELVRATAWPAWYGNAKRVVLDGGGDTLALGTTFHWNTFGVRVHTTVSEFVPGRRLSWSGRGLGATAYHGWVIEPRDGGCLVVTEETQQGFIASLGRWFFRRGLRKWHQRWLEGLASRCRA